MSKENLNETTNTIEYSIDIGVEKTPIRLGNSDKYLYMDFNDTNFPARLVEAREDIANFLEKKRKEMDINGVGTLNLKKQHTPQEIEKAIEISRGIDKYIKDKIDYIFGYEASKVVFGNAHSASVTRKGEYYFDNFLNSVVPLVEKEYGMRIEATKARIKKYTDKKGMHPANK